MQVQQAEDSLATSLTYPDQPITVAMDRGVKDNRPANVKTTYREFFELLGSPDPHSQIKDGPGFLNGPCNGLRRKVNVPYYEFAVIDGDSSVSAQGEVTTGAPSPLAISDALKQWNISHHLYTTYSHGSKGSRWRLLIPCPIQNEAQLLALVTYIVDLLREYGKLPLFLSKESVVWGNRWHLPRTPSDDHPFFSATHFGEVPDPAQLAHYYGHINARGELLRESIPSARPGLSGNQSIIAQFCHYYPLPEMLRANGYEFESQSIAVDKSGADQTILRFRKPGSKNPGGVVVFWDEETARWRGYSHHTNDILATGYSFDSFDVMKMLGGDSEDNNWTEIAVVQIRDAVLEEMRNNHPVILEGGKFRIGYRVDGELSGGEEFRLMRYEDFAHKLASRPGVFERVLLKDGSAGYKMNDLAPWWKACRDRLDYDGTTFKPTRIGQAFQRDVLLGATRYFNLFNGWPITPEEGRFETIDWHFRHVLCGGVAQEYEYLMDWLAHMFQFPEEKPGVALVLRSGKGTGKSLVMARLCKALGTLGMVIANSRQLTGEFNGHMRNKLLAVVEESFWAGNHSEEGPLKHIITDEYTTFERKGVDAESGKSFLRVVLVTNNLWAAPASADERRFAFLSVSEAGKERNRKEGNYFSRLEKELSGGGINALAHFLMNRRIDRDRLRTPPTTRGLVEQKLLSLTGIHAWVYDMLKLGVARDPRSEEVTVLREYPHDNTLSLESLMRSAQGYLSRNDNLRSIQTRLLTVLAETVGGCEFTVVAGQAAVRLPGLQVLRENFNHYLGGELDWGQTWKPAT